MALNVDCLLEVLKQCTPEAVCRVSRADYDTNLLINRYIKNLPRTHWTLQVTADASTRLLRCTAVPSCGTNVKAGSQDRKHEVAAIESFCKKWRYAVVDEVDVNVTGDHYDNAFLESIAYSLRITRTKKITLRMIPENDWTHHLYLLGMTLNDVLRFLRLYENGFRGDGAEESGATDHSELNDFIFNCKGVIHVGLTSQPLSAELFIVQFLREVAKNKEKQPCSFFVRFSTPLDSWPRQLIQSVLEKIQEFAVITENAERRYRGEMMYVMRLRDLKTLFYLKFYIRTGNLVFGDVYV